MGLAELFLIAIGLSMDAFERVREAECRNQASVPETEGCA